MSQRLTKEQNIPFMGRYIETRMPNAFQSSEMGRLLQTDSDRSRYVEQLQTAARTLIGELKINPRLFQDAVHKEFFLALCDGLVGIDSPWGLSPEKEKNRGFIYTAARVLAGPLSEVNLQEARDGVAGSERFVFLPGGQQDENEKRIYEEIMDHVHLTASWILTQVFTDFGSKSKLDSLRQQLGITQKTEKFFDVRVLWLSRIPPSNEGIRELRDSDWKRLTSPIAGDSGAFFWQYPKVENSNLYFPIEVLGDIHLGRLDTIGHEYFHTQKSLYFGLGESKLGRIFDEGTASFMAQSATYLEEQTVLQVIDGLTGGKFFPHFLNSLRRRRPQEVYKFISDNFGFWSLLILAADQPDNYDAINKCFDSIPGLSSEFRLERSINRTTILCRERVKLDPNASGNLDNFTEKLHNPKTIDGGKVQKKELAKVQFV